MSTLARLKGPSSPRCLFCAVLALVAIGSSSPSLGHSEDPVHRHEAAPGSRKETAPGNRTGREVNPAGRTTVTGEIVDATCYLKKGSEALGPDHRDCAIRCMKDGRPPVVRDEATGQLYLATFSDSTPESRERWLSEVGKRVRVVGKVQERDGLRLLEVDELTSEHDHAVAPHGGLIGMSGDRHIELVTAPDSEIRIYVLDAFMSPLTVAGVHGTAIVKSRTSGERRSALVPDSAGTFLRAADTARQPDDAEVTVDLETADGPLTMNLPFPEAAGTAQAEERSSPHDHHHH